jgi:endo-1,4-beta-D-glucanase Y
MGGMGGMGGTGGAGGSCMLPTSLGPGAPSYAFGSHPMAYPPDVLLPSGSQAERDNKVKQAYDTWKARYVREGCGGWYVLSGGGTGENVGDEVSEGHGYGMVITAMMAGYDPNARKIFDGMYAFYRKFPSQADPALMSWTVDVAGGCKIPSDQADSATDGDLDIAYALLVAERQWPNSGYLIKAQQAITAVDLGDMHPSTKQPMLGNWVDSSLKEFNSTRPSDFMLDHFRAFGRATCSSTWSAGIDSVYQLIAAIQKPSISSSGLLPDFVIDTASDPKPPVGIFLEGPGDGEYSWNACRVPWRLATDYLVSRDARAKTAVQKMNTWVIAKSGGHPGSIATGYALDGSKGATDKGGHSSAFASPFGVAALLSSNQAWVDTLWTSRAINEAYYADSITMMSLLVMSGNWWAP